MSKTTGVVSINVAGRKRRPAPLRTKDFLSVLDLRPDEFDRVLDLAATLKRGRADGETGRQTLAGKFIALLFEKPSLRTRQARPYRSRLPARRPMFRRKWAPKWTVQATSGRRQTSSSQSCAVS